MKRILFANIGWMVRYQGQRKNDKIKGGGSYNPDDKHEAYNFQKLNGHCYGYVQPTKWSSIKLKRIDSCCTSADHLDDVLVVWTATNPTEGGTYIVGWYKHARVYQTLQNDVKSEKRQFYQYNIEALASDCTLLTVDNRLMKVPRATNSKQKGFMGQSNIWYADSDSKPVIDFREKVLSYIKNTKTSSQTNQKHTVNSEAKRKTEQAAIGLVTKEYESRGYEVVSVEKENKGWDLEATKGKHKLRIEVKGLSGDKIAACITKNEYKQMKSSNCDSYRLCIVIQALHDPKLFTFSYDSDEGKWICEQDYNLPPLSFDEQVAAIAYVRRDQY